MCLLHEIIKKMVVKAYVLIPGTSRTIPKEGPFIKLHVPYS